MRSGCKGRRAELAERINELAVAKILAEDKGLKSAITYEPELLSDNLFAEIILPRRLCRLADDDERCPEFRVGQIGMFRVFDYGEHRLSQRIAVRQSRIGGDGGKRSCHQSNRTVSLYDQCDTSSDRPPA